VTMESETALSPDAELRALFRRRRTRRRVLAIPVTLAVLMLLWVGSGSVNAIFGIPDTVLVIGLFAIIVGAFVFQAIDWRCPKCGEYLGRGVSALSCRRCGFELQPDLERTRAGKIF
jgi:hypothetical protein